MKEQCPDIETCNKERKINEDGNCINAMNCHHCGEFFGCFLDNFFDFSKHKCFEKVKDTILD